MYDVVRRFAQPLGIHLEIWEGRIIETTGGMVRLMSVSERRDELFDEEESQRLSTRWEVGPKGRQTTLFPDHDSSKSIVRPVSKTGRRKGAERTEDHHRSLERLTTLDRLHKAMLMQANGASAPLRSLLQEEKKRGPEFERLARSLNALYPRDSEERRLVEALALVIPR